MDVETTGARIRVNGAQKILRLDGPQDLDPDRPKDAINKALDEA
jgi:hypothetical protein